MARNIVLQLSAAPTWVCSVSKVLVSKVLWV